MKKKVIRILVMLSIIIGIIFSISTYAGTGKLYTNLAALNPDGVGYGIGDPTNKGKYIWHMSTYNSTSGGLSDVQKNIYCLKGDYGASWETFFNTSPILEYNLVFDLQGERQEILNKIVDNENDADEVIQSLLDVTGSQYREVLWLLDNMYIKGENNKEVFLAKVGIEKDEYEGTVEYYNSKTGTTYGEEVLTDDDIIAIQRVAIWTFTNGGDFDKTQNQNWLRITTDASNYNLLGSSREAMAEDLYKYLVSSAKTGASLYTAENNYTINDAPVGVNVDGLTEENGKYRIDAKSSDSNYIIGPIVIKKNNDFLYKISMDVKNESNVEIDSSKYSITDANGTSLGENVNLKDLVDRTEGFYIKIDKSLATKFNIQINVAHYNTTKNLWLQGAETTNEIKLNAEQPIAEFSREEKTTTMEFVSGPESVEVSVTKVWEDRNNQDGIRPTSIGVNLKNGDTIVDTVTLNETNNWTYTFTNLPKKSNGTIINYTIEETGVPTSYISGITGDMTTGYTITNTHLPEAISVKVTKVWEDSNNQEVLRPASIDVNLKNGNTTVDTVTLSETNNWTYTFTNLPKKSNGTVINYTVEENNVPAGYTSVQTGDMTVGYTITNTHIPEEVSVKVSKVWEDSNDQDGIRPDSIVVNLKNGNTTVDAVTLNETNNWTYTFTNLPKKSNGTVINYTVEENGVPTSYTTTTTGDMTTGYTITNSYTPETIEIPVTKVWEDSENQDRIRPESIDVDLKKGNTVVETITLNETNNWTHTFTNLPKNERGTEINYTVEEKGVPGSYISTTTGDMSTGYIITNTHVPGTTSVKVIKVWDDGNDQDRLRPNTVTVKLLKNDVEYDSIDLSEANNWKHTFSNLPEKENNEVIEYTIKEITQIDGYTTTIQKSEETLITEYTITNKHIPNKTFDLALRKYITKINDKELSTLGLETRVPEIKTETIETNKTATYNHKKDPVKVEENDIVTYAITIYNEGEKLGYASQIIDQLPTGLIYIPSGTITSKDSAGGDKNKYVVTYEASTNKVIFDIVNSTENPAKELQPFEENNLDSETIEIKCKVVYRVKADSNNILTNVAWINEEYDSEDSKTITTIVGDDRDSEPQNAPKVSKDNMEDYKGNTKNPDDLSNSKYFYEGQQDDDDFEKIYVKTFDLSLRKFISSVNGKELEESREPIVDVTPLKNKTGTTAIYKHPKTPVAVKNGDTVIYTIRVYNEGEIAGSASEVKDYLSPYLLYVKDSTVNSKYKWNISEDGRIATTTYLTDKEISGFNGTELDYEDLQIECKISIDAVPNERITNIAEISEYKYGNLVNKENIDSSSDNITLNMPNDSELPDYKKEQENNSYVPGNEDDDDFEKVYVKEFDLALRKFITQVQGREITNRIPQVKNENGVISYEHPKDALTVHVGDKVIYTLRIYNEGEIDGYASEVTDDIPEYLEYIPDDSINVEYKWEMYDKNGNETQNTEEAVNVKTAYLSKDNGKNNLLMAFDGNILYYRDIKIAFKVKDPNSNTYIITNHAQISNDTDEDGNEIKDKDSYTDKWNEGEDDQDIENVKVEYFDLSILKFVSKVIVQEDNKETITETGYNGHENPKPVVKVELHKKKLDKVTVKFGYGITVTNEGDMPGAATEITDYVPEGLKFDKADNPEWTDEGNNVVSTTQLKDVILQPGESKTIEIILTWINDRNNMALKTNTVEISKDANEYNVPDKDSISDNKKDGEDDIDTAKVMLAIATGRAKTYFTLTLGLLTVIATGVFLIKKFVL